jgi:hypothetical protein
MGMRMIGLAPPDATALTISYMCESNKVSVPYSMASRDRTADQPMLRVDTYPLHRQSV